MQSRDKMAANLDHELRGASVVTTGQGADA